MREHQNCMPFLIAGSTEKKKTAFWTVWGMPLAMPGNAQFLPKRQDQEEVGAHVDGRSRGFQHLQSSFVDVEMRPGAGRLEDLGNRGLRNEPGQSECKFV